MRYRSRVSMLLTAVLMVTGCSEDGLFDLSSKVGSLNLIVTGEVDPRLEALAVRIDGVDAGVYRTPLKGFLQVPEVESGFRLLTLEWRDKTNRTRATYLRGVDVSSEESTPVSVPNPVVGKETLRIALLVPKTGPLSFYGGEIARGAWLAQRAVDAMDVPFRLELVELDSRGEADRSAQLARDIARDPSFIAIVGPATSGNSTVVAEIANEARLVSVFPVATSPGVTEDRPWAFRGAFDDRAQGEIAARVARSMGLRAAVVYGTGEGAAYSETLASIFLEGFTGEIVTVETFELARGEDENRAVNFTTMMDRVRRTVPDLIFTPVYGVSGARLLKAARQVGLGAPFLGGDGLEAAGTLSRIAGPAADGLFVVTHWAKDENPSNQEFIRAYEGEYHQDPTSFSALAWDTILIISEALSRVLPPRRYTRDALREGLVSLGRFSGATYYAGFGANNTPIKSAVLLRWFDGKQFQFVRRIDPE